METPSGTTIRYHEAQGLNYMSGKIIETEKRATKLREKERGQRTSTQNGLTAAYTFRPARANQTRELLREERNNRKEEIDQCMDTDQLQTWLIQPAQGVLRTPADEKQILNRLRPRVQPPWPASQPWNRPLRRQPRFPRVIHQRSCRCFQDRSSAPGAAPSRCAEAKPVRPVCPPHPR